MPKIIKPLTSKEVAAISKIGLTTLGGVAGLMLLVKPEGARYFVYRFQMNKKRTMISLGAVNAISLKQARESAAAFAEMLRNGIDPVEGRRKQIEQQKLQQEAERQERDRLCHTVAACAEEWIRERAEGDYWINNVRGESVMRAYFANHINPVIGDIPISALLPKDVFGLLKPLWQTTTDTGDNCKSAVFKLFQWAKAKGYCSQENPADLTGVLGVLLEPFKANRKRHQNLPALDFHEVPDFMAELMTFSDVSYRMTAFSILTVLRSKMVRLAKWADVDFEARTLRIPNSNFKTKGRGDHTVYLSDEALSILTALPRDSELIFPSPRLKKALSDAAMGQVFSRLHQRSVNNGGKGWVDPVLSEKAGRPITATQHGTARASFKTWSKSGENRRLLDEEAVELCMAHKLKDDYGGAYNRATLEAERRAVMAAWGRFCFQKID